MRKLGTKVLSEHSESTPVGGQIVDLQARIANLKASEKAIQAIMAKANTIGDVLTVQQRLAEVQGQIEQLSGQLQGLTDQAAYSTLTVILVVPVVATPSPSASPTPSP
jgi:TolA-binding protein